MKELFHNSLRRLIVGFPGASAADQGVRSALSAAEQGRIGGVILFQHNIVDENQLVKLCNEFHERAFFKPFLICVDQEGGRVERITETCGVPSLPAAKDFAKLPVAEREKAISEQAAALRAIGINVNFSPCADLDLGSPPISALNRAYSESVATVSKHSREVLAAFQQHRLSGCLKHYPGHGSALGDTHQELIEIQHTWRDEEEAPFRELVQQKIAQLVMLSHLKHSGVDPDYPVSLSYQWIDRLRSYRKEGLCLCSDDFHMSAIQRHWETEQILNRSFCGGVDFILFSNNPLAACGLDFSATPDFPLRLAADALEVLSKLPPEGYGFLAESLQRVDSFLSEISPI